MSMLSRVVVAACVCAGVLAAPAAANTSHEGWPRINGVLFMNKTDSDRPLDARPGKDPFGGEDPDYSCDAIHSMNGCVGHFEPLGGVGEAAEDPANGLPVPSRRGGGRGAFGGPFVMANERVHNELLGGHGNDTIHAGPAGDVLWADYKPSGQPTTQRDVVVGGAGRDFIYASHGHNTIDAGAGNDWLKAHYGRGSINCGPGNDLLYVSRRAQRGYKIRNCERISHKTLGY
jgi:Ca2+-binding RTX toxin-like protein